MLQASGVTLLYHSKAYLLTFRALCLSLTLLFTILFRSLLFFLLPLRDPGMGNFYKGQPGGHGTKRMQKGNWQWGDESPFMPKDRKPQRFDTPLMSLLQRCWKKCPRLAIRREGGPNKRGMGNFSVRALGLGRTEVGNGGDLGKDRVVFRS